MKAIKTLAILIIAIVFHFSFGVLRCNAQNVKDSGDIDLNVDNYKIGHFVNGCPSNLIGEYENINGNLTFVRMLSEVKKQKSQSKDYICFDIGNKTIQPYIDYKINNTYKSKNIDECPEKFNQNDYTPCTSSFYKRGTAGTVAQAIILPFTLLNAATGNLKTPKEVDVEAIKMAVNNSQVLERARRFKESLATLTKAGAKDLRETLVVPAVADKTGASLSKLFSAAKCLQIDKKAAAINEGAIASDLASSFAVSPVSCEGLSFEITPDSRYSVESFRLRFVSQEGNASTAASGTNPQPVIESMAARGFRPSNYLSFSQSLPAGAGDYKPGVVITGFTPSKLMISLKDIGAPVSVLAEVKLKHFSNVNLEITMRNDTGNFVTIKALSVHIEQLVLLSTEQTVLAPHSSVTVKKEMSVSVSNQTALRRYLGRKVQNVQEIDGAVLSAGISVEYVSGNDSKTLSNVAPRSLAELLLPQ